MSDELLVSGEVIYFVTAAILAVGSLVAVGLALRSEGRTRTVLLAATVPAGTMAVAYVFMGLDLFTVEVTATGREQSVARFVGYTAVLFAFSYVTKETVDLSWRQFAALVCVLVVTPWAALLSWVTTGAIESATTALAAGGYLAGVYVLFGPTTRAASVVTGERRLLFSKLRNLFVLCWGVLILQSGISEQALGLTDFFVGQIGASYTDVIFLLGIAGLVVSGKAVFEQSSTTGEDTESDGPSQAVGVNTV